MANEQKSDVEVIHVTPAQLQLLDKLIDHCYRNAEPTDGVQWPMEISGMVIPLTKQDHDILEELWATFCII